MIYRVHRQLMLLFYTISMLALSVPLAMGVRALFPTHFYPLLVFMVLYLVLVVVLGSVIHTISYIPYQLARAFDPIKNNIASGEISSVEDLGKCLCRFTEEFYDFAFIDVDHAFIYTEETGLLSHQDLSDAFNAMESFGMDKISQTLYEATYAGKVEYHAHSFHLVILPLWFGDQWLGYMGILSRKRIGRFHLHFLNEFEEFYLDDQLMYLKNK